MPVSGRYFASNVTLRDLVLRAYDLSDSELDGGPDWQTSRRFDIQAKAADPVAGLTAMLDRTGLAKAPAASPPLRAKDVNLSSPRTGPAKPAEVPTRFALGQSVRTRVIDGPGHTRLPRYAQARTGVIAAHRGDHLLPDDSAAGLLRNIRPLYSVRFTARELFGEGAAPADSVFLDLWEDYLEPA